MTPDAQKTMTLYLQANRIIGGYIGTLKGVKAWAEIPSELKLKLEETIAELEATKITNPFKIDEKDCCGNEPCYK